MNSKVNMSTAMAKDSIENIGHAIAIHDDVLCGCDRVRVRVTDCE